MGRLLCVIALSVTYGRLVEISADMYEHSHGKLNNIAGLITPCAVQGGVICGADVFP